MRHAVILFSLAVLGMPTAHAAELTRIASSFEDDKPFGFYADFAFDGMYDSALIAREWHDDAQIADFNELDYARYQSAFAIDVNIGLYRDLALHIGVPIIFQQDRYWTFAEGVTAENTTLYQNCTDARASECKTPGAGTGRLFDVGDPHSVSYRAGLGDFTFGLAYAPFIQKKDPSKPNWIVRFDLTVPTAAMRNPSEATSSSNRGAIGDKVFKATISTALSKRLSVFEPYMHFWYTLPWQGLEYYGNCDNPSDTRMARAENCGVEPWTRSATGIQYPHMGGFNVGGEITLVQKPNSAQRFAIDLRGVFRFVLSGRYYTEVSDLLGKLTYTSDYMRVGGQLGLIGQISRLFALRGDASVSYNTERVLTNELIGEDLNGNGYVDFFENSLEVNPNYDNRIDLVGRRLRIERQVLVRFIIKVVFSI